MAEYKEIPKQRIIYQFEPGQEIVINAYKRTYVVGTVFEQQENGFGAYWVVFKYFDKKRKVWVYDVNRDVELSWHMQTYAVIKDTLRPHYQKVIDNYKIRIGQY